MVALQVTTGQTPRVDRLVDLMRTFTERRNPGHETVAFELIVPHWLARARELGIDLPYADLSWIEEIRARKLALVPHGMVAGTTLVHTLEALGRNFTEADLSEMQSPSGAFGCSPAATAYAYGAGRVSGTLELLREATSQTGSGGLSPIYPFDHFETCWSLHFRKLGGTPPEQLRAEVAELARHAVAGRLGMSAHGVPVDSDDTAVLTTLLRYCGLPEHPHAMDPFERPDGYATYDFERTISISTNVHALPVADAGCAARIVESLRQHRIGGAYWLDKWHLSPYYPTAEAVHVLADIAPDLHRDAVRWMLDTQHPDGSWGHGCEETAYVLLALMNSGVDEGVEAGMAYLRARRGTEVLPELWIGKTLYTPFNVVRSAIDAAHRLFAARRKVVTT
ncbi:hypothetical protein ACIA8G_04905 [Lentzea sp. NPDC051213]|uniref:hypothetical protein n=1 Tax=Lentzea sp. NPDC051213 TaxID=3364126 RepID=UPI0037BD07C8